MSARPKAGGFDESAIRSFFEYSLLGMLVSGYLALLFCEGFGVGVLGPPGAILMGAALLIRALKVGGVLRFTVPRRWVTIASLAYMAFYPLDYVYLSKDFVNATIHLVLFVAVVQTLAAEKPRDFTLLKLVAFLELLGASLFSTHLTFFLFLAAFLLTAAANLGCTEILRSCEGRQMVTRGAGPFGRRLGWLTGVSVLGILAVTCGLFFLLPRTARAALERFGPLTQRVSGFSNEVTLGQLGEIERRSAPVMHVRFGETARPETLRWRATALGEFNGLKWYNTPRPAHPLRPVDRLLKLADDDSLRAPGRRATYEVNLHSTGTDHLFIAGTPEYLRLDSTVVLQDANGGFRVPFTETEGMRYVVYGRFDLHPSAAAAGGSKETLSPEERDFYLRLPPLDPKVAALAKSAAAGGKTDLQMAKAVENFLLNNYRYSLVALDHETDDPLAYFLLEGKKGHCEYFASSMAVLLRSLWIPARVVTGFLGGTVNPINGVLVVRASDAHTWVEAWIPGSGWTTFDPTPPDPNSGRGGAMSRIAMWADAVESFWQDWVLGYDLDRQLTLAFRVKNSRESMGFNWLAFDWTRLRSRLNGWSSSPPGAMLAISAFLAALVVVLAAGPKLHSLAARLMRRRRLRRGEADRNDASLIYRQMLDAMRKRGVEKPIWMTPVEFVARVNEPDRADAVREFTVVYNSLRFGGRAGDAARLVALLDRIEQLH
jgi:protein-glutamine gamma-glutamyltransferase